MHQNISCEQAYLAKFYYVDNHVLNGFLSLSFLSWSLPPRKFIAPAAAAATVFYKISVKNFLLFNISESSWE